MKRTLGFLSILLLLAAGAVAQQPESPEPPAEPDAELEDLLRAPSDEEVEDIDAILEGEEGLFGEGDGYSYDPAGRRDPFVSLLARGSDPRSSSARPAGLPGLLIAEVAVKGIVRDRSGFIAMIQGPSTKTFIVRTGEKLLDGSVKAITADAVVFSQDVNDPLSMVKEKEVRKTVRSADGGRE